MSTSSVFVFGKCLITKLQTPVALRYAQAIREGMWQCAETNEPWVDGNIHKFEGDETHTCSEECCDTRTDDEVEVMEENSVRGKIKGV